MAISSDSAYDPATLLRSIVIMMQFFRSNPLSILALALLSHASECAAEVPDNIVGPLTGHVDAQSASIWMHIPKESKASVTFWQENQGDARKDATIAFSHGSVTHPSGQYATALLKDLSADTPYHYEVKINGKGNPAWSGGFQTAPPVGQANAFRMALTSCMKASKPQTSWYLLLAQQPDLHLTVGDTHYADTTDPTKQLEYHLRYRREPFFATVIRNIPTYSIWDDHDYGPNNSDGTAQGKENSLAGWQKMWANPSAGTPEIPGAFFKFTRGEVEFFVVDGRYHRSPDKAPDDDQKRMLGDEQFTWLLEGLKSSKAKFKVIASGSTLDHSKVDGWKIYTFSRHRLFDSIKEHKISGVMYMSGDVHKSLVWEHPESERVGYPLVEVISSGIANSETLSFATIDFDTTLVDPTARVRIVYGDGTVRDDRTWKLSQLSPSEP